MIISSPAFNKLSVVIPCCNEERNLARFPQELFSYLGALKETEYIFIDDGSTDETFSEAHKLTNYYANIHIIRHPRNMGLGAALRTGFHSCTGDAILTLDADLTFHPSEIQKLLEAYKPGIDAVIGSPVLGHFDDVPVHRRILSNGVNWAYRHLLSRPITAMSSMFRLYRSTALRSLELSRTGFDINAEIILQLLQRGEHVVEIPVTLRRRQFGESKMHTVTEIRNHIRMFGKILRWRFRGTF